MKVKTFILWQYIHIFKTLEFDHSIIKSCDFLLQYQIFLIPSILLACAVSSKSKPGRSIIINTKEIKENKHITNQIKETKIGKKEHKRSLKFRDNIRKQLIETLTALENPRSAEQLSTSSLSPCAFSLKSISLEDGFCTFYGACRLRGQDYMYQVGVFVGLRRLNVFFASCI